MGDHEKCDEVATHGDGEGFRFESVYEIMLP